MRPDHLPELPWTIRTAIVWAIITTTVFASVAGWHNFLNYLLTAWAFVTFIPAALLILIWWALPVRHFGSIISLILHGRHHHRRGH